MKDINRRPKNRKPEMPPFEGPTVAIDLGRDEISRDKMKFAEAELEEKMRRQKTTRGRIIVRREGHPPEEQFVIRPDFAKKDEE